MSKRKVRNETSCSSINPLSDARKKDKSGQKSDSSFSKADLKAKELWHRKSGAGYRLFVEYYAGQTKGVVHVDDDSDSHISSRSNINLVDKLHSKRQKGLSRAAKRRKKKKGGTEETCADLNAPPVVTADAYSMISSQLKAAIENRSECKHIINFLSAISQTLPLTLRIRHASFIEDSLKSKAEMFISELKERYSDLVRPVSYDSSNKTIFQATPNSNLSKFSLGKISPNLKRLIMKGTSEGIIARQELGSMLPVIALAGVNKLEFGSKVLDMCASPGSKTLQALEIVGTFSKSDLKRKKGRIVANDIHPLRLESLQDAIKRSGVSTSLTQRIIYTNHDASKFPTPKSGSTFDCIIADVPCSGDGTVRKDPHILPNWMPSISNSLHHLQMTILKRAIKLLKIGGVVAYSTCSLNPIEDEAVVASVLSWGNRFADDNDAVELLDWPDDSLPGLKFCPGVETWRVADYVDSSISKMTMREGEDSFEGSGFDLDEKAKLTWYDSFEDTKNVVKTFSPTMWPPTEDDRNNINLKKCRRLLPGDNNTGGFFVALIRKNTDVTFQKNRT
eukprot:CAMPEP_0194073174 /NCGR_PEP_ID=MMETSP0149-20130528/690_1 /TAXON_ID=122233 /ORGANISM="Chaetoceros debilis, Strain MM31A-1" /LENGTH=562 /DNA_ID=CAMNT_0038753149 /DNA_START=84 /DNA_END=1772 /DNA_ORIENTATION=+